MISFPRTIRYTPVATETVAALAHSDCDGGVTFVVYQKSVETAFSNRVTKTATGAARCAATGTEIPAMAWTDEMERDFARIKAEARLAPTSYRVKPEIKRMFAVLAVVLTLVSIGIWYHTDNMVAGIGDDKARVAAVAAAPAVGDYVLIADPELSRNARGVEETRFHWYVLRAVTDEAVALQADPAPWGWISGIVDQDPARFTGETLTVSRASFLKDGRMDVGDASVPVVNAIAAHDKANG